MVTEMNCAIHIFTLGRFEIRSDDRVLDNDDWSRRKAATLLQRLALDHRLHKEQAIEFLWPHSDPTAGANNLYRTLYALRQTLDEGLGDGAAATTFAFEQGILRLNNSVWVDVQEFERLCSQVLKDPPATDSAILEQALELYQGDLLPDERYAEWTIARRDHLHRCYRKASLALAVQLRDASKYERAIQHLVSLLNDTPVDEPTHRELMRIYALAGRRHDALRQYQSCVEALASELDVPPAAETETLHTQILNGELTPSAPVLSSGRAVPTPAGPMLIPPRVEQDISLVGREAERKTIQAWLQAAWKKEGRTILLAGDTGVGKTRLAYEMLRAADRNGMTTLWGSAYEQEERLPYQPFVEAFDRYLAEQGYPPGENPITHFRQMASEHEHHGQWTLFNTAAAFLADLSVAAGETPGYSPVVLFLDDLHAADEASLHLFQYLARHTRTAGVILLATYRSDLPTTDAAFDTLLNTLYRERLSKTLPLPPLSKQAVTRLLADVLGGDVAPTLMEAICDITLGNPFYIEEIIQALLEDDRIEEQDGQWRLRSDVELRIPEGLGGLLYKRVTALGDSAQSALTTAAVLGRDFEFDLLRSAAGLPAHELLDVLDLTLTGRLLDETEHGYRFRHPLIRRVLYDSLSRARRAWLHGQAAAAIETVYGGRPAGLEPRVEELAYHYEQSDRREHAPDYLIRAGRKAARVYAFEVAVNYLERALSLLDTLGPPDPEQRCQLLESIGTYHAVLANTSEAVTAFERALAVTGDDRWRPRPTDHARLHRRAAKALLTGGQVDATAKHLQTAMDALHDAEETRELAYVLYNLAQLHWHRNEYADAFDMAQDSLSVAERLGDVDAIARAFEMLALACHSLGEWQQGIQFEDQRASLAGPDLEASDVFDVHH